MKIYILLFLLMLSACEFSNEIPDRQNTWGYSQPNEVGVSNESLKIIHDSIQNEYYQNIKSLIIVKNGNIIFENYYDSHFRAKLRPIGISTLIVTTAALGHIINDGYIHSLDTPIYHLLPMFSNVFDAQPDKKLITIRHLLNHKSGISWNESTKVYVSSENDLNKMKLTEEWADYVIKRELGSDPGTRIATNSASGMLLSVMMQYLLGDIKLETYIQSKVLNPLGITHYNWLKDPAGNLDGATGLFISDLDYAKLGYLYINNGKWNNKQVIPEDWAIESLQIYSQGAEFGYGYGWRFFSPTNAQIFADDESDIFFSPHQNGQFVFCYPKKELLISIYAENLGYGFYSPSVLLFSNILNAIPN
jgi:CubicO group peptidase (beta-lactamase class C family)